MRCAEESGGGLKPGSREQSPIPMRSINTTMGNKLYVGNLSFNTTEIAIQDLFSQCGTVSEVMLMQDKFTGRSRGFAFVTMGSDAEAQAAVTTFHGKDLDGRALTVNEARPREDRPAGGGGGGGGGGRFDGPRRDSRDDRRGGGGGGGRSGGGRDFRR